MTTESTSQYRDKSGEPDKPQNNTPPIPELTIRIMPDLSCQVTGPISDRIMAYGMLESARDVIHGFHVKQSMSKNPNGGLLNFARKLGR